MSRKGSKQRLLVQLKRKGKEIALLNYLHAKGIQLFQLEELDAFIEFQLEKRWLSYLREDNRTYRCIRAVRLAEPLKLIQKRFIAASALYCLFRFLLF